MVALLVSVLTGWLQPIDEFSASSLGSDIDLFFRFDICVLLQKEKKFLER